MNLQLCFLIFDPKIDPKTTQVGPRRVQEDSESDNFSCWFLPSILDRFGVHFESILNRFWVPKCSPNRPQMDPKTIQNRTQKSAWEKCSFGTLLVPSWVSFWLFGGPSWAEKEWTNHWFLKGFVNIHILTHFGGTWVDYDAKKGPTRLQNRSPNGAKWHRKTIRQ